MTVSDQRLHRRQNACMRTSACGSLLRLGRTTGVRWRITYGGRLRCWSSRLRRISAIQSWSSLERSPGRLEVPGLTTPRQGATWSLATSNSRLLVPVLIRPDFGDTTSSSGNCCVTCRICSTAMESTGSSGRTGSGSPAPRLRSRRGRGSLAPNRSGRAGAPARRILRQCPTSTCNSPRTRPDDGAPLPRPAQPDPPHTGDRRIGRPRRRRRGLACAAVPRGDRRGVRGRVCADHHVRIDRGTCCRSRAHRRGQRCGAGGAGHQSAQCRSRPDTDRPHGSVRESAIRHIEPAVESLLSLLAATNPALLNDAGDCSTSTRTSLPNTTPPCAKSRAPTTRLPNS